MKKLILALASLAAFSGSALAADLSKPYVKAPPPVAPAYNWTGFYVFGGGGGGLWAADQHVVDTVSGTPLTVDQRQGGSGWFGTVGAGYDWQFNSNWVAGVFGDGHPAASGVRSRTRCSPPSGSGPAPSASVEPKSSRTPGQLACALVAPNIIRTRTAC